MADSIRQQIINAIDTRMKTIRTVNGYKTNAGAHVFDWLDRDLADSELDAIGYRDTTCKLDHDLAVSYINRLRVEFIALTKQGSGTAVRLRQILEDMCSSINVDETWGGLADATEPVDNSLDIQQAEKILGVAALTIEIEYTSNKWAF